MDYPFTTDGCSGGRSWAWRKIFGTAPPWEGVCIEHDKAYYAGGTADERRAADRTMRNAMARSGVVFAVIGFVYWCGVRVGGVPWRNTTYRWGYGWDFDRRPGYQALTFVERMAADKAIAEWYRLGCVTVSEYARA